MIILHVFVDSSFIVPQDGVRYPFKTIHNKNMFCA